MKKLLIVLFSLIVTSCYYNEVYSDTLSADFFHDQWEVADSSYYINFSVTLSKDIISSYSNEVNIQFAKKVYMKGDVYIESLKYFTNKNAFKTKLMNINNQERIEDYFMFGNNMRCSWRMFDEIYDKYMNE